MTRISLCYLDPFEKSCVFFYRCFCFSARAETQRSAFERRDKKTSEVRVAIGMFSAALCWRIETVLDGFFFLRWSITFLVIDANVLFFSSVSFQILSNGQALPLPPTVTDL